MHTETQVGLRVGHQQLFSDFKHTWNFSKNSQCQILRNSFNCIQDFTCGRTGELTPWISILLEKPPVTQLLGNFPKFYGTWKFITVFTRTRHWSISCTNPVLNPGHTTQSYFFKIQLMLSSNLWKVCTIIFMKLIKLICTIVTKAPCPCYSSGG
jgi:hypothetical protein